MEQDRSKTYQKNAQVICRFILLFTLCSNFISVKVSAQFYMEESFPSYSYYLLEVMDMNWKTPQNFIWKKTETTLWSQGEWGRKETGSVYIGSMQSEDGNCLILYPECNSVMFGSLRDSLKSNERVHFAQRQMIYDMRDAWEKDFPLGPLSPDMEQYVVTLTGSKVPFHADTVLITQLPLKSLYLEKYKYCTAIYAYKQGRPSITFKCFFTEEGKTNEKKYLTALYKAVKYRRNKNWRYDNKKSLKTLYDLYRNNSNGT